MIDIEIAIDIDIMIMIMIYVLYIMINIRLIRIEIINMILMVNIILWLDISLEDDGGNLNIGKFIIDPIASENNKIKELLIFDDLNGGIGNDH